MRLAVVVRAASFASLAAAFGCGGAPPNAFRSDALVVIDTWALAPASSGAAYEGRIEANGPHPPLTWRLVGGRLPEGLVVDADSGVLSGFPRREGTSRFTIEVEDGLDAAAPRDATVAASRRAFDLVVARGPVAVLPLPVAPMQYGAPFTHRFTAAGGAPPYAFAADGGAGPPGMTLHPDGSWSGIPSGAANPYSIAVRVSDAEGASAEGEFDARVVVLPLAIDAAPPPDAALGHPYDAVLSLHPQGAGPPYAWRVVPASGLPPGLTMGEATGEIAGVATALGTFAFRLEATDASGQTARRDAAIHVNTGPALHAVVPGGLPAIPAPVTLVGAAFEPGMTAKFGAADAIEATVVDATHATAVPPREPIQSGWVAVSLANPDGGTGTKANAFRYPLRTVQFVSAGVKGTPRDHSRGIAAGDVDHDGLCDLVHVGSAGIEVLRPVPSAGPVGPTYTGAWTSTNVRSDGSYLDVRLADVDADGDLDIVALRTSTTETIEVYWNDGKGKFPSTPSRTTTYVKPSSNHNPNSLAVGDVDGDGVPDVAFTSSRGNQGAVWVYRGLGDGSFAQVHEANGSIYDSSGGLFCANGIALADLNGDGRDDLLVSDGLPAACAAGQPCPTTPSSGGMPNAHPGGGDFAAWACLSGPGGVPGAWKVARLSGAGIWLDGCNEGLAALDFDGDGTLDLAVFGGYQDSVGRGIAFLAGDGAGGFSERLTVATAYDRRFGARIDANLDGFDDVIVVGGDGTAASGDGHDFSVAECWAGGPTVPVLAWTTAPEGPPGASIPDSNPGRVAVGDFDGDGLQDFAVDQSFNTKERFGNEQADGRVEGVAIYLNRSH